jgi:hypothetical protein
MRSQAVVAGMGFSAPEASATAAQDLTAHAAAAPVDDNRALLLLHVSRRRREP